MDLLRGSTGVAASAGDVRGEDLRPFLMARGVPRKTLLCYRPATTSLNLNGPQPVSSSSSVSSS